MYYRKSLYTHAGQADVPDDLWAEFQRIRGHLSNLDQNNFVANAIARSKIIRPDDLGHNGTSDIVGEDGGFLYKQRFVAETAPGIVELSEYKGQWVDLGNKGLDLRAQSKGDAPWIVAASVDVVVRHYPGEATEAQPAGYPTLGDTGLNWDSESFNAERANLMLRIKSSQGGLSVAESVGGFNPWIGGCSIPVLACFLCRGGPVEFSPSVLYSEVYNSDSHVDWEVHILRANIFAFGLYN